MSIQCSHHTDIIIKNLGNNYTPLHEKMLLKKKEFTYLYASNIFRKHRRHEFCNRYKQASDRHTCIGFTSVHIVENREGNEIENHKTLNLITLKAWTQ